MKTELNSPPFYHRVFPVIGSALMTVLLFITLPLTQWIAMGENSDNQENQFTLVSIAPPPMVDFPEEETEEIIEEEEIELEQEAELISLDMLDIALNPGAGGHGIASDFDFDTFNNAQSDDLVFNISELDKKPEVLVQIRHVYPYSLKRQGIQGRVIVVFIVDEQGTVSNVKVTQSPNEVFSESARTAVRQWKFKPGQREGRNVKTRVRIPLTFSIRK